MPQKIFWVLSASAQVVLKLVIFLLFCIFLAAIMQEAKLILARIAKA